MDTIKTLFLWPVHATLSFVTTVVGWCILAIPCLIRLIVKGRKGYSNNAEIFSFFNKFPLGTHCFSSLVPFTAPYSGSVECHIRDLSQVEDTISCSGTIENYPWLRNPFQSVHAVAMTNVGELVSGLGMLTAFQVEKGKYRGIPTKITTEYFKKAKVTILACSSIDLKQLQSGKDIVVETVLRDKASGEEVAKCFITW
eukprot:CAMPEP_0114423834 /NCGR_PEP_ID=MMETSP0103-20121206/6366_1 /TAXON_ID=37642 ORGANISM="Paraphysomonas imperforata, Strain PA2" /NCGR_SAMPLE_ID=MMETSP0103 /ASSEMBLY_ACC=CAM_ASM_000201 /LENGTH=197 /DNA_ID=CAMNT_0001592535 /DNA_START=45 /DNA_END=635 /DNA_ORIENTATION=+